MGTRRDRGVLFTLPKGPFSPCHFHVKVRCRLDHRPPHLDLAQYPHLPGPRVTTTAAADYLTLLGAGAE